VKKKIIFLKEGEHPILGDVLVEDKDGGWRLARADDVITPFPSSGWYIGNGEISDMLFK